MGRQTIVRRSIMCEQAFEGNVPASALAGKPSVVAHVSDVQLIRSACRTWIWKGSITLA
jgi:hypothetical protein